MTPGKPIQTLTLPLRQVAQSSEIYRVYRTRDSWEEVKATSAAEACRLSGIHAPHRIERMDPAFREILERSHTVDTALQKEIDLPVIEMAEIEVQETAPLPMEDFSSETPVNRLPEAAANLPSSATVGGAVPLPDRIAGSVGEALLSQEGALAELAAQRKRAEQFQTFDLSLYGSMRKVKAEMISPEELFRMMQEEEEQASAEPASPDIITPEMLSVDEAMTAQADSLQSSASEFQPESEHSSEPESGLESAQETEQEIEQETEQEAEQEVEPVIAASAESDQEVLAASVEEETLTEANIEPEAPPAMATQAEPSTQAEPAAKPARKGRAKVATEETTAEAPTVEAVADIPPDKPLTEDDIKRLLGEG